MRRQEREMRNALKWFTGCILLVVLSLLNVFYKCVMIVMSILLLCVTYMEG